MWCRVALTLLLSTTDTLASDMAATRDVLYNRRVVPPTWHVVGRAAPMQRVHFVVALRQKNLKVLEEKFWAVANPKSPHWQQHMSIAEINVLIGARKRDMLTVKLWLKSVLGVSAQMTATADALDVRCSVAEAERLFDAQIFTYAHDNGHTILRTMGPHSVPAQVKKSIDFVEGLADFPMHRSSSRRNRAEEVNRGGKSPLIAPQSLLEMYSIPADHKLSNVSQAPVEFQDDTSYNKADLKAFFQQTNLPEESISETVGPYNGAVPDTEATLDVQYITSVGQKQDNWYWTADNWMYQWSHNFFNSEKVPDAVSISWGWAEDQQCSDGISQAECQTLGIDSQQYVARVNTEFMKIGLRGVSIFVASGDSGANGRSDSQCTDSRLHASFPGSSPYVTTVGATMLQDPEFKLQNPPPACKALGTGYACASGGTEVAVSAERAGFTSGGGFSTYSPMPSYQKEAVSKYLAKQSSKLPPASYFNRSNRAFPDVAAMGNNFLIYMADLGGWSAVGGTSAATPTVAGIAAYLNDLSYTKSGKPLGFMNPLLYQMQLEAPEAFTDVVEGDNRCTEDGCFASCKGYEAAVGWDPVTGLGTPVASKMLAYLEAQLERRYAPVVHV